MSTTYKDLQRITGLSLATISKFYNGGTVRQENAHAIERAAERLGYRPNGVARSLRSRRSGTIGVLLPALDNDFHLTVIAGVESALRADGVSVIVASSPDAAAGAVDLLLSRMVDGIVAVPSEHDVEALRRAAERVPVVQVDWRADGLDTDGVYLDNHGAGALAARHLVDHGHRRLAVIGGDQSISTMRERTEGFVEVARAHGAEVDDAAVSGGPLTVENGRSAMQRLLLLPDRPSAVFCANYELTLGAVITLNESGLRLGQDLSVAGFDGLELAQATVPKLTVVVQPTHELAVRAAERIRERLDERDSARSASDTPDVAGPVDAARPVDVVVPPRLVAGGSVARLPRPDSLEA